LSQGIEFFQIAGAGSAFIVITSDDGATHLADSLQALGRIGRVAHNVTETDVI
jgi:streptogramin lyase